MCIKLVIGQGYTKMHGQRNIKRERESFKIVMYDIWYFIW